MFSMVYISDELVAHDEHALAEIARTSAPTNHEAGLTGYLSWKSGRFFQYIEGEESAVRERFADIDADERHRVIRAVELDVFRGPQFDDWHMRVFTPHTDSEIRIQDLMESILHSMRGSAFSDGDLQKMLAPMIRVISRSVRESRPRAPDGKSVDESTVTPAPSSMTVVGIGASAGGLQPLQEFFRTVPPDLDAAFVIVQHLSPDSTTAMDEILGKETAMPIRTASEGMTIQPRSAYLIPPGENLEVKEGTFHLSPQRRVNRRPQFPIDIFFHSMAAEYGADSIAVILSGTGTDGSRGILSVHEVGGVVLAQSVESAEFDGMPAISIQSGIVQQTLKPFEIAQFIDRLVHEGRSNEIELDQDEKADYIRRVVELMPTHEVNFSQYRPETMFRRIERRRLLSDIPTVERYIEHFASSETERSALRDDLLITVTSFFRDEGAWNNLRDNILPDLIGGLEDGETLRAWVTACATGEEAYTLAMVLIEAVERDDRAIDFKVYATDIERRALAHASAGHYGAHAVGSLTRERLERFFEPSEGGYAIDRSVRERVIFAPQNFVQDTPFTRMHLVTCRNVLIYMQPELQQRAIKMLHFSLAVDGVLFLGASETLGAMRGEFFPLRREWNQYRKLRDSRLPLHLEQRSTLHAHTGTESPSPGTEPPGTDAGTRDAESLSLALLAAHTGKTILLVDRDRRLALVVADPLSMLEVRVGVPSRDVTSMVPEDLGPPLTIALRNATHGAIPVRQTRVGCRIGGDAADRAFDLEVRPRDGSTDGYVSHLLVLIGEHVGAAPQTSDERPSDAGSGELREELDQTRQALQNAIDELTSSGESQRAINEQLSASNEELQSTNEELQSVNEELYTVNFEYQSKIHELSDLNHDLDNLLASTRAGVVYLDTELHVRRFTDRATSAINLLPSDIGRPFADLSSSLGVDHLDEKLAAALTKGLTDTRDLPAFGSRSALRMSIHPYRIGSDVTQGVMITFLDLDEHDEATTVDPLSPTDRTAETH